MTAGEVRMQPYPDRRPKGCDDPTTLLTPESPRRRVTADQLPRGYVVRYDDGRLERRPYTLIATFPDGTALVTA